MQGEYLIKGGDAMATVSALGGTVTTFIVGGKDFFYSQHAVEDKIRGGCPMCAPWFGSSPRGVKKHGFLRDMNAYGCYIDEETARFDFRGEQPGYPWSLNYITMTHLREDGALEMVLRIKREEDEIVGGAPVNPGFHPFFACKDASKVEVVVGKEIFKGFTEEARMIPLKNKSIWIIISNEKFILMKLSGDFFSLGNPQMVFWTDAPDKYVCVEPIFQDRNMFDTPQGFFVGGIQEIELGVSFEIV